MTAESPTFDLDNWRRRLQAWPVAALPDDGRRRAAVVLPLTEAGFGAALEDMPAHADWQTDAALLLTRRAAGLRAHAGQWALPGGRIDAGETAEDAALRELAEEVALRPGAAAVLGRLDDYATRSGYVITPVVVAVGAAREVQPNPAEVASVHRVPVSELLRADAPILNHVAGAEHPVLRMPLGTRWIAAPTAAFLYQFREVCVLGRPTRVAHFDQPRFAWQ
ncbi:NUDIX hydrolase [Rubrivivax albus]|nr:CoA pyrophosphatase [Rubrivivax albus]